MLINVGKVKIAAGKKQDFSLQYELKESDFGYEDLKLKGPLSFNGEIENLGKFLQVKGHLQVDLLVQCDRCLKEFPYALTLDIEESFTNRQDVWEAENEEDKEIYFFSGDSIDVLEMLVKQIYLNLPMRFLCQPDCKGLCPHCGIDLNEKECHCAEEQIDPRWAVLKDFKFDKE